MKSRCACVGVALIVCMVQSWVLAPAGGQTKDQHAGNQEYRLALPGYRYEFPRDHFDHPEFQTEWWYYTGNVKSADGHRFGFELTFFRQGVNRDAAKIGAWDVRDLYLAHLALSDLDGRQFYHAERTNRAGPGVAGISAKEQRIWNGNWQIAWNRDERDLQELRAVDPRFELRLELRSEKAPVIHGEGGVSQKAEGPGRASHYISLTRLVTSGRIVLNGKNFDVSGLAWMDHEFFTHQLEGDQVGWDWFSVQLTDDTELMLFRIRRKDGTVDPYSAGTFIDAHGASSHLRAGDFSLSPAAASWTSAATKAKYPVEWKIAVPRLGIELAVKTSLPSQELAGGGGKLTPSYWEGAVTFDGVRSGAAIRGVGYLEMTGYDRPFEMGSN